MSVTVIAAIGLVVDPPLTENAKGTVSVNWPPYWFDCELLNQDKKSGATVMVTLGDVSVALDVGVKLNVALVISSVVE